MISFFMSSRQVIVILTGTVTVIITGKLRTALGSTAKIF